MSAPLRRLLALTLVVLSLLGACSLPGTSAPTATPPPTTTAIPATATVPPVTITTPSAAPATPTAAATPTVTRPVPRPPRLRPPPGWGYRPRPPTQATPVFGTFLVVQDARQACELTLPVGFAPTSTPGSFASADGKMLVTLQSLPAGPDDTLDDLALPFVEAFIPTVQGYEQTSVIRLADNLRIDFTGNLPGVAMVASTSARSTPPSAS